MVVSVVSVGRQLALLAASKMPIRSKKLHIMLCVCGFGLCLVLLVGKHMKVWRCVWRSLCSFQAKGLADVVFLLEEKGAKHAPKPRLARYCLLVFLMNKMIFVHSYRLEC